MAKNDEQNIPEGMEDLAETLEILQNCHPAGAFLDSIRYLQALNAVRLIKEIFREEDGYRVETDTYSPFANDLDTPYWLRCSVIAPDPSHDLCFDNVETFYKIIQNAGWFSCYSFDFGIVSIELVFGIMIPYDADGEIIPL